MKENHLRKVWCGLLIAFFSLSFFLFAEEESAQTSSAPEESPSAGTQGASPEVSDSSLFEGTVVGRVVVLKRQVDEKEEKKVFIIGKVTAKDEDKLDSVSLAELKRLGRKRLEVVGESVQKAEALNGKVVAADGTISFSKMSINVSEIKEEEIKSSHVPQNPQSTNPEPGKEAK